MTDQSPRLEAIEHFESFMMALGLDIFEPHLKETARRVVDMYRNELLRAEPFAFTTFEAESSAMILVKDIPFASICAHHFVPFRGVAHVAYIPDASMAGLSKLARTVDMFARQPQVQERMTEKIAEFLVERLQPKGVAVMLEAEHLCMAIRGVQKPGTTTVTAALRGAFMEKPEARAEFYAMLNRQAP